MGDVTTDSRLWHLIGQHPAALRSVSWDAAPAEGALAHLEVETKHGAVVVFDHRRRSVYANPPRPAGVHGQRRWRDLTERVPSAFDGRPTFAQIRLTENADTVRWIFELSTGAAFTFVLDRTTPLLLPR